jgi:hypothetical protein
MTVNLDQRSDFNSLLASTRRSPEIPEAADVYGWLCGSWDLDVLHYRGMNVAEHGAQSGGSCSPRWTFTEITADSFHWRGEALYPDKQTWTLEAEFLAKRRRT